MHAKALATLPKRANWSGTMETGDVARAARNLKGSTKAV